MRFFVASFQTRCLGVLLLMLFYHVGQAQLTADFDMDHASGCSPLTVLFTNKTKGASPAARYNWDFGNGNSSTLPSPGAVYRREQTYTITLKVTDGGQTSSKSKTITVYKKPVVDFTSSLTKGCFPLEVEFNSQVHAGDGTIQEYFWDFGDGKVASGDGLAQVKHTYAFAQTASVSLTVTNSFGCYTTVQKNGIVQVVNPVTVSFGADKTRLCRAGETVHFTNTSTGTGTLSYEWDFGDGATSAEKEPAHQYTQQGTYTVKLKVVSPEGCSSEASQVDFIHVASFQSGFETQPQVVCDGSKTVFAETATPAADSSIWDFGDGQKLSTGNRTVEHIYKAPGTYTVTLTNKFGTCIKTGSKEIVVKKGIKVTPFVADFKGVCGAPVPVSFRDTSAGAVAWNWTFPDSTTASGQEASYNFASDGNYDVNLKISSENGCTAEIIKQIRIGKPAVDMEIRKASGAPGSSGCAGLRLLFAAKTAEEITEYNWNFGDGTTATDAQPQHVFDAPGRYDVTLRYKTSNGCEDSVTYKSVAVYARPRIDFSASSTTVCGNSPVTFTATADTAVQGWQWWFGDNPAPVSTASGTAEHRYYREGVYTVRLVANNNDCSDTVTKVKYIHAIPPFPRIVAGLNTCSGDRMTVTFKQASKKAETLTWDFGDSTTLQTTDAQLEHTYAKSGTYKVVLTATNGQCVVKDSVQVFVLRKPSITLSADKGEVCASDSLSITVTGMEDNPYTLSINGKRHYSVDAIQYADGSLFKGTHIYTGNTNPWSTTYTGRLSNFDSDKEQLRVILSSRYFGCTDTTNFIPLKIGGPKAAFSLGNPTVCLDKPIIFKDASKGAAQTWEWDFGDGTREVRNESTSVVHTYNTPGTYLVSLKVTNKDGCFSILQDTVNRLFISGPRAAFILSDTAFLPPHKVSFTNTTALDSTNSGNVQFTWLINDQFYSSAFDAEKIFTQSGFERVQLVATHLGSNCSDTAEQLVHIKRLTAAFTYTAFYLNSNACPPLVGNFKNESENFQRVSWNFGDGSTAANESNPSHTYISAGEYRVVLYAYGDKGQVDSTIQFIKVEGPSAVLASNVLSGCVGQKVQLSAVVKNAQSFTWDFGDGTLRQTPDTFGVHQYLTGGLYTPALILQDSAGCTTTAELPEYIIIDSLQLSIKKPNLHICDSGTVTFEPQVESIAVSNLQKSLAYEWSFGTGNSRDTAQRPSFHYGKSGTYEVRLKASSPYGCVQEARETFVVHQTVRGVVNGPADVCVGASTQFTALPATPDSLHRKWIFPDGSTAEGQTIVSPAFASTGSSNIQLVVTHDGCSDTTAKNLTVHAAPVVQLASRSERICLYQSVQLSAAGGTTYQWAPATGLDRTNSNTPMAAPQTATTYTVQVTNEWGCSSLDSVRIEVVQPQQLQLVSDTFVCGGSFVQLRATGTDLYQWLDADSTLSNPQIPNPLAAPRTDRVYTVVGGDADGCFTDTARVLVRVKELPTVWAGDDIDLIVGTPYQIKARASADVIRWQWSPGQYLNCTNCAQPVAKPLKPMTYTVRVQNQFGCVAVDSITINAQCADGYVYIPNAFTPNGDGLNETFSILGKGVRLVKLFRIYNRWGEVVFERRNFPLGDHASAWDGRQNGQLVPMGTYVYTAEMECEEGTYFLRKGTVTVIR